MMNEDTCPEILSEERIGQAKEWSKAILNFRGCENIRSFEFLRKDLIPSKEDPLA